MYTLTLSQRALIVCQNWPAVSGNFLAQEPIQRGVNHTNTSTLSQYLESGDIEQR